MAERIKATVIEQSTTAATIARGAGPYVYSFATRTADVTPESQDYAAHYDTLGTGQAITDSIGQSNGICPLGADGKVPAEYTPSGLSLQGGWDAATNTPTLDDANTIGATDGQYWLVDVAGSTTLNGISTWNIGDWALWSATEPGNWMRVAIGNQVTSVFGRQGIVTAATSDYDADQVDATPSANYLTQADVQSQLNAADATLKANSDTLTNHKSTVSDHGDVTLTTPTNGDILVYATGEWINATAIEDFGGAVAATTLPQTLGASVGWSEIIPGSAATSSLLNLTYAAGRFTIDYSGASTQPVGTLDSILSFSLAVELGSANTTFSATFAINGTEIPNADDIGVVAQNGAQSTAGLSFNGSLLLPRDGLVDGDQISIVYTSNNAVDLLSFVLSVDGKPDTLFVQR